MLAGPKLVRDLLETCSLASLGLCVSHGACVVVSLSKVHHASKSETCSVTNVTRATAIINHTYAYEDN